MSSDNEITTVAVIGAGIMGSGIARAIFKYGFTVRLYDVDVALAKQSVEEIRGSARRNMDPEKIIHAPTLGDALKGSDLVIEAVVENLDLKCTLFAEMGKLAGPDTVFASNTSSLSISTMAEASGRIDRFLGLHFFNPPVIMRLVELTKSTSLNCGILDSVMGFLQKVRKKVVICRESPGFVVNRLLIPLLNEAFYLLDEKIDEWNISMVEGANDIDSAVVNNQIMLLGPFDLVDMTGIDTAYHVSQVIYHGFGDSKRYLVSPLLEKLYSEKRYGRKGKHGVYRYDTTENDPVHNPKLGDKGEKMPAVDKPQFDPLDLVCVIVNEAFRILDEGIVERYEDIEVCMEEGTRWPKGPFALARETGLEKIREHLLLRYESSGKAARYEPSPLLMDGAEKILNE